MKFRNINRLHLAIIPFLACVYTASARDVSLEAGLSQERIYIGESTRLTLKVNGFEEGMEPDFSRVSDCNVTLRGQTDQSVHNVSIVNGRRQVYGFSGRIFQYDITPSRSGTIKIGPIIVTHNNQKTTIPGPTLTVVDIEKQDQVILFLESTKDEVIIEEEFDIHLRVLISALPSPFSEASPLPIDEPPRLNIPYLKENFCEGLEGPDIQKMMNSLLINNSRTPGLAINNFSTEANPFDTFFNMRAFDDRRQPARFNLRSSDITYKGKAYHEYRLGLHYTPIAEGAYTFGPVSFKGPIFAGATRSGQGITKPVYAVAEAKTVRVVPPPEEGRPASFVGAIGRLLEVSSSLDAQTCRVGDPLTLDVSISGDIRLDNLFAPRLELQENLNKDFRIYEDTVQSSTKDGIRTYRYTVRPTQAGTLEFPPIAVSYYNTETRSYDTVFTEAIPIRANKAKEVEESIVIDTAEQSVKIVAQSDNPNLNIPAPILLPTSDPDADMLIAPRLHGTLLLLGPVVLLLGTLFRATRRLIPAATKKQRQRSAAAHAVQKIKDASRTHSQQQNIAIALREFVADRLDIKAAALTPSELAGALSRHNIPDKIASEFVDILEKSFNAGFQSGDSSSRNVSSIANAACEVISKLDCSVRPKSVGVITQVARRLKLSCLILACTGLVCAATAAESFDYQLAMTRLMTAQSPDEFDRAAQALARVIDAGTRNGQILYNYGTASLLAGNYEKALDAFKHAEHYSGTTWELSRNMLLAVKGLNDGIGEPRLAWYRAPLFWHFKLPGRTRISIALFAFLAVWLAFLMRMFGWKNSYRTILSISLLVLILFGSSATTTLYQEFRASLQTSLAAPLEMPTHSGRQEAP